MRDIFWSRHKIQETLSIGQWYLRLFQSRHLGTSHSSSNCHQLSHCIFLNFINGLKSLPFQWWFWEKPEVTGHQIWPVERASHLGDLMFNKKTSAGDMMREPGCCCDEAARHQLPIAAAFWIIWIVAAEECSTLMQNLMQIHCSTHSVTLNATATQFTCSLNDIFCPHWLVQWSPHRSGTHIPVHSPWLPGYIVITQTVRVVLTMAGLFSGWTSYIVFCLMKVLLSPFIINSISSTKG